jgi:Protein of unknown function (DUF3465)
VIGVVVGLAVAGRLSHGGVSVGAAEKAGRVGCTEVQQAFRGQSSGVWLTMAAPISRVLVDSHGASTHQRFILRCPSGQTVLIDNNVDVGRRAPVAIRERVVAHGQYIWNGLGGLIHDTHHSTGGSQDGWLLVGRTVYQ